MLKEREGNIFSIRISYREHIVLNKLYLFVIGRFQVNALNGQLSILRVTKDDYGNYTCRAKNTAGEDEAKVLINVLIRPRIYELWNITRPEHEEAELICKATGQ